MDPLRNAKRRASARSPRSRRSLCQTSLSSPRSGGSRSSNDKGLFRFSIATSHGRIVVKLTGEDELLLIYGTGVKEKVMLRKYSKAGGVTDESMPKSAF